jgi:hypothetical protein
MAQERDSILRVRAKIDSHDELEEANIDPDETGKTLESHGDTEDRVTFCSAQRPQRVRVLAKDVSHEISISGFVSKLAKFLKAFTGADITEPRLKVCSVCDSLTCLNWDAANIRSDSSMSFYASEVHLPHERCT